jgi:hypothetical protein
MFRVRGLYSDWEEAGVFSAAVAAEFSFWAQSWIFNENKKTTAKIEAFESFNSGLVFKFSPYLRLVIITFVFVSVR